MGLKAVLASKADLDALPEALRSLYVEQDGKFVLDADVEEHPKVGGLRSALTKERDAVKNADKQFRDLKAQIGDLDPEKARQAIATVQELQDKKLLDEGKVEELIKARTDRMSADHNAQREAWAKTDKTKDETIGKLSGRIQRLVLDGGIRDAALKQGVKPHFVDDVVNRMTNLGVDGVKWTLDENAEHIVAKSGDSLKYGKDPSKVMSPEEGLALLREQVPDFFGESKGGGADAGAGGRVSGRTYVISNAEAKDSSRYRQAREEAVKHGLELVIQG